MQYDVAYFLSKLLNLAMIFIEMGAHLFWNILRFKSCFANGYQYEKSVERFATELTLAIFAIFYKPSCAIIVLNHQRFHLYYPWMEYTFEASVATVSDK